MTCCVARAPKTQSFPHSVVQRTQHASQVVFHPSHLRCRGVMCVQHHWILDAANPGYSALLTRFIDASKLSDFYSMHIDRNKSHG